MQYLVSILDPAKSGHVLAIWLLLGYGLASLVVTMVFWAGSGKVFKYSLGSVAMILVAGTAYYQIYVAPGSLWVLRGSGMAATALGVVYFVIAVRATRRTVTMAWVAWSKFVAAVAVASTLAGAILGNYVWLIQGPAGAAWVLHGMLLVVLGISTFISVQSARTARRYSRTARDLVRRAYGRQPEVTRRARPWWWYARWLGVMAPVPFIPLLDDEDLQDL